MKQGFDPVIHVVKCELSPPSLRDNTADWDRFTKELRKRGYFPVFPPSGRLKELAYRIRELNFRCSAILKWNGFAWEVLEIEAYDDGEPVLGMAFDLGTTRIAYYLTDLREARLLYQSSVENPQIPYGEDILSRITYANSPEKQKHLQKLLISCMNDTIHNALKAAGMEPDSAGQRIYALSVAGNTTMSHFFAGLNPSGICKEPYIPVVNRFPPFSASEFGLNVHPNALLYLFPNVGSYFGGDVIAGIIATEMHQSDDISMLIDVGTNAEVVLGNREWMIACAGAAGPALEGGVVERGMMAAPGAIDRVRINPETLELTYTVIGGAKPRGICGSGLIDLIAEMFQAGLLTIQGKINRKLKGKTPRIIDTEDGTAFVVAYAHETDDGRDLIVTDIDIGILLKSKAAMYTILNIICRKVGLHISDVKRIYVAGTFGNHIDPAMAIRIGMLPDLPLQTFVPVGNTSGKGALKFLLHRRVREEIDEICDKITYIELNVNVELMHEFRGALFIPHTDPRLFPSVHIPEAAKG